MINSTYIIFSNLFSLLILEIEDFTTSITIEYLSYIFMKTQAYFENIQERIANELALAETTIKVAVAWFSDDELFEVLCQKAQEGVNVELILMDDRINQNSGIDYSRLNTKNGKVWKIKQSSSSQPLMHNKFCAIDSKTIINGSYNWTKKAQRNQESITIVKESQEFALDFEQEFANLKEKYFGKVSELIRIDFSMICMRLEALKNVILLQDIEDISYQTSKLKNQLPVNSSDENVNIIHKIIELTLRQNYGNAVSLINEFTRQFKTLTIFIDPEIIALKLEITALEIQVSSLEDERSEMEKEIFVFQVMHDKVLGEIILKILGLRKERLKTQKNASPEKETEYSDAEKDYNNYKGSLDSSSKEKIHELSEEQLEELKITFRKASKLCHPDIVADKQKEKAHKVFIELKKAFDKNDLNRVREIYNDLKKGAFVTSGEKVNERQKLLSIVIELRSKRNDYENVLRQLKESETYQTIQQIKDWDEYFEVKKKELSEVLEEEQSLANNE